MPAISIATPFNFAVGATVTHYKQGEQDVPQAVADHAKARGYLAKAEAKPKAATPAKAPLSTSPDPLAV